MEGGLTICTTRHGRATGAVYVAAGRIASLRSGVRRWAGAFSATTSISCLSAAANEMNLMAMLRAVWSDLSGPDVLAQRRTSSVHLHARVRRVCIDFSHYRSTSFPFQSIIRTHQKYYFAQVEARRGLPRGVPTSPSRTENRPLLQPRRAICRSQRPVEHEDRQHEFELRCATSYADVRGGRTCRLPGSPMPGAGTQEGILDFTADLQALSAQNHSTLATNPAATYAFDLWWPRE